MEKIPSMFECFKIYWAISWRSSVAIPIVFIVAFLIASITFTADDTVTNSVVVLCCVPIALLIMFFWQIFILRFVINKDYKTFHLVFTQQFNGSKEKVTLKHGIKIFWSFMWRCMLFGILSLATVGIVGIVIEENLFDYPIVTLISEIIGIVFGIYAIKLIVNKNYGNFRLQLLNKN